MASFLAHSFDFVVLERSRQRAGGWYQDGTGLVEAYAAILPTQCSLSTQSQSE